MFALGVLQVICLTCQFFVLNNESISLSLLPCSIVYWLIKLLRVVIDIQLFRTLINWHFCYYCHGTLMSRMIHFALLKWFHSSFFIKRNQKLIRNNFCFFTRRRRKKRKHEPGIRHIEKLMLQKLFTPQIFHMLLLKFNNIFVQGFYRILN